MATVITHQQHLLLPFDFVMNSPSSSEALTLSSSSLSTVSTSDETGSSPHTMPLHESARAVSPEHKPSHVSFATHVEMIPARSPLETLSEEELEGVWYHAEELMTFRQEARELCRKLRVEGSTSIECTRGLESRASYERQKRKVLGTRCIVKSQGKLVPDRLAALAQRCTQWAVGVAHEEGTLDHAIAYDLQPPVRKRLAQLEEEEAQQRRVRPRRS